PLIACYKQLTLSPLTVERGIRNSNHSVDLERVSKKFVYHLRMRLWVFDSFVVAYVQRLNVRLGCEPRFNLRDVLLEHRGHLIIGHRVGRLAAANEHLTLRSQNLRHSASHEDHLVVVRRREMFEQRGDQLNNPASRVFKPSLIVFDLLDALELEIAFG